MIHPRNESILCVSADWISGGQPAVAGPAALRRPHCTQCAAQRGTACLELPPGAVRPSQRLAGTHPGGVLVLVRFSRMNRNWYPGMV